MYIERAMLCKTPRQEDGPFVILLFSDGHIMYNEKGDDTRTVLPIHVRFSFHRFFDAMLWEGSIVALNLSGLEEHC